MDQINRGQFNTLNCANCYNVNAAEKCVLYSKIRIGTYLHAIKVCILHLKSSQFVV